jgi:hypothetical protein
MAVNVQADARDSKWEKLNTTLNPDVVRGVIAQETRNWGFWLLVMGFAQLAATNLLDSVWGVALILVGAASFYLRSAAMLPVYGVTMAWAMISNISSGDPRWIVLGLFQGYWSFKTFRQFILLRSASSRLGIGLGADTPDRSSQAAAILPWAGCALSAAAPIGLVALIIAAAAWPLLTGQEMNEQMVGMAYLALMDSACLGLALGVAAHLARYRWRLVSILAGIGGGLMLGLFLLLIILS